MYKGFAGILTAILVVLAYLPLNVQAASAVPAISFVADWYNTDNGTYIILTNKGTLGTGVDGHTWQVYEKAVDSYTRGTYRMYNKENKIEITVINTTHTTVLLKTYMNNPRLNCSKGFNKASSSF